MPLSLPPRSKLVQALKGQEETRDLFVRMLVIRTERTFSSVDLRDFESIPTFFSEKEMAELQAAIDERRSRRLALGERSPEQAGQPDCSPDGVEAAFYDVRTQHPA